MADGAASAKVAIAKEAGVPLAETQGELTPLQRMVIEKVLERQNKEMENAEQRGGRSMTPNSAAPSHGAGQSVSGETVEYVNENA